MSLGLNQALWLVSVLHLLGVRITILDAALWHSVEPEEIRAVVEYPLDRTPLNPRLPGTRPWLYIGKFDENEPPIEVMVDLADTDEIVVFHAMMLRLSTAVAVGLDLRHPDLIDEIVHQRPERKRPR